MEPDMIFNFVKQAGYNTKKEIEENFSSQNIEIVSMQLEYLVEKKLLGRAVFASTDGHGILYYVIYHKEG